MYFCNRYEQENKTEACAGSGSKGRELEEEGEGILLPPVAITYNLQCDVCGVCVDFPGGKECRYFVLYAGPWALERHYGVFP